ncbi:MAG: polysaccharide pyruvyl transferase family protein, partial [Phycisphaeraceae bacterium]
MRGRRPIRVLVLHCVTRNGGDAAILYALSRQIRDAFGEDAEITAIDASPDDARSAHGHLGTFVDNPFSSFAPGATIKARLVMATVLLRIAVLLTRPLASRVVGWIKPGLRPFVEADVVVATGGTYLVEHYNLAPALFSLMLARASRRPVVYYTQSLGPSRKPHNRRVLRWCMRDAGAIFVREERSRQHLQEIGVRQRVKVCADAAFALPPASDAEVSATDGPRVAISLRQWAQFGTREPESGMSTYLRSVASAAERLIEEHHARIEFVSTCQGIPSYKFKDDEVARRCVEMIREPWRDAVEVNGSFHTPTDLLRRLLGFDFVLSTRMHMAILSMVAERPVHAIAYEFKTVELFSGIGLSEEVTRIESIEPPAFAERVSSSFANRQALRQRVREA